MDEYYQIPAILPLPGKPRSEEDLYRWATEFHRSIRDSYIPQADRIENMVMVGESLDTRPDPIGSRRYFYHQPLGVLYLDVVADEIPKWAVVGLAGFADDVGKSAIGTGEAEYVTLDTADFDEVLSWADLNVQLAMDTIDDHHHLIMEIAASEPADVDLENGEAVFWYEAQP